MKLKDYMEYLKILHDRYGDDIDVQVNITVTHDALEGFEDEEFYQCVRRPKYDPKNGCLVIHKFYVDQTTGKIK